MDQGKREHRELKRIVKRAGRKHARKAIKRVLSEDPEDAPHVDEDFGRHRSAELNGIDKDPTRKRAASDGTPRPS